MYKIIDGHIIRIGDNAFIPLDQANRDYKDYLAWLDLGNNAVVENTNSEQVIKEIADRVAASKTAIKVIPNWALWSEPEALAWIQTNIGMPLVNGRANLPVTLTLASTRVVFVAILDILDKMLVVIIAVARLSIALRDKNWPELPEK